MTFFKGIKFHVFTISSLFVLNCSAFDFLSGLGGEKNGNEDLLNLIKDAGYPAQRYFIKTTDNYILGLYRIPKEPKQNGKVVLLMHDMFFSAADFLIKGPNKALAYVLSDAGYDVWLGNARGNTWSRNHTDLDPDGSKFWNFSIHEIAVNDLPAMINFVLTETNEPSLHYIGHSQGSTVLFILLAELPAFNAKLKSVHIMVPVLYVRSPSPLGQFLRTNIYQFENGMKMFDIAEFLSFSSFFKNMVSMGCNEELMTHILCRDAFFAILGRSESQFNITLMPEIFNFFPAGAGFKQMMHFGQFMESGKFQKYDYKEDNMVMYGQPNPPEYNLSNIQVKIQAFYGSNDLVQTKEDSAESIKALGDKVIEANALDGWNHVDFLYGNDVDKMVYEKIIEKMSAL